jgi:hypothetical protein
VGTTATVTFNGGFTVEVGQPVSISGVTPTGYNGIWTVTASSAGSVSFTVPATLANESVNGTLYYGAITGSTLNLAGRGILSGKATQTEAEAGTDNSAIMTPLRTAQEVGVPNSAMVKSAVNATGTAPIYACRAFVYFNGANGAIILARNVSGVTRTGEGQYTVSFDTDAPSTSYSALVTSEATRGRMSTLSGTRGAGSFKIITSNASFDYEDAITVAAAAFW